MPHEHDAGLYEPRPNQPFSIHVPDAVWIVRTGKLDLFLVDVEHGEPAGARYPLVRVEEGLAVFGMKPSGRQTIVAAVATPGTQLLRLSRDLLRTKPASGNTPDTLTLLEDWIFRLAAGASSAALPRPFIDLEAGKLLEVTDEAQPIIPVSGVLWVEHKQGSSKFLNSAEIAPINSSGYFPICRNGWLRPAPQSRIFSLSSSEWQKADPEWRSLQTFHEVIFHRFVLNRQASETAERERRRHQVVSDAQIVVGAIQSLASPLQDASTRPIPEGAGVSDPTFLAFEAVAKALDIKAVAPTELLGGGVLQDPVPRIAGATGVRYRRVVLKGKWWAAAGDPLLAFRDADRRPLALLPTGGNGYRLYDPTERRSVAVNGEVALALNGFAYTFYRPFPNRTLTIWDLLTFGMHDTRHELFTIVMMGICAGVLGMLMPIATGVIFNSIIPSAQRSQLLQISAFLVVVTFAGALFTMVRNYSMLRLEGKMGSSLQAAVWDRLLRLPVPFFRRYTSGDLADRSLGIAYILHTLTGSAIFSVLSGIFSIFSFLLLFYYSWELAVLASCIVLISLATSAVSIYIQIHYFRRIFQTRGRISGMLLEFIGNIGRLRVAGAEPRAFAVWAREFAAQKDLSQSAEAVSNGLAIFNSAFPVVSMAAIFAVATNLMGQPLLHALTTGTFLAFVAAFVQFQSAALGLSSAVESALSVVPVHERALPILEALPEVLEVSRHPGELRGSIEVSHVNFRYHDEAPLVLRDVSFSIKPGEFVAIVGPSGSGKSSIFRLLLGFEKPESGAIYYDAQDLSGLDVQAVRKQIGVVMQNARLVSGSIFENIVGSAALTLDDAWDAARSAGLEEDIRTMPMGMHTIISEGGGNISGGQRQRLLIARAIVKKPRLFLFDEATSALDNRTQAVVSHSLEALQSTRVVIAHRLSTIVNASRILVVEKGVLVQSGTYDELSRKTGLFCELTKRQLT